MRTYNLNCKQFIKTNLNNYSCTNPIGGEVKRKKVNGSYIYENFYLIDFFGIKENSYVISSFGRLFSLISNRELKPSIELNKNNYHSVILATKDGGYKKFPLHSLIAIAFVPKTEYDHSLGRIHVHHKNWDNDYNYYWNLEWRSPMEIKIMTLVNRKTTSEEDIVRMICKLLERDTTIDDIFHVIDEKLSIKEIQQIQSRTLYKNISSDFIF